jgi:quinol monooxygenase YgiN
MVRLTLTLTAPPGESWRLIEALRSLMVPTRREHGCVSCQLHLSTESTDPTRIRYTEDWSSEERLREQVRSERFPRLLAVMERALEPPEIRFDLESGARGLDYVAEVRAAPQRPLLH